MEKKIKNDSLYPGFHFYPGYPKKQSRHFDDGQRQESGPGQICRVKSHWEKIVEGEKNQRDYR
jgi:hypothetical protein